MSRFKIIDSEPHIENSEPIVTEQNITQSSENIKETIQEPEVKINDVIQLPLIQEPINMPSQENKYEDTQFQDFEPSLTEFPKEQEQQPQRHKLFGISHYAKKNIGQHQSLTNN